MKSRTRKPVRRYHDRVAGKYDAIYSDAYWSWHNTLTWDYLKPHLPTDLRLPVIDLGCGTGLWGIRLLKSGFNVTFVDISPAMLDQARRKVVEMGMEARARFLQGDLMALDELESGGFALATAFGEPLGSVEKPAKALKETRRILMPGGVLVGTLDNRLGGIEHYLREGQVEALEAFLRTGRTQWCTKDAEERFDLHTFTPDQVRRLLERAGFELLSLIGKTVLPMRPYRALLEDPATARRLLKIEKQLARDPDAIGRAPHIQFAATRKAR